MHIFVNMIESLNSPVYSAPPFMIVFSPSAWPSCLETLLKCHAGRMR